MGKFLQDDPLNFNSGDLNLSSFVFNDPYNWRDPMGLTPAPSPGGPGPKRSLAKLGAVGCLSGVAVSALGLLRDALAQQAIDIASGSDEITFGVDLETRDVLAAVAAGCVTVGVLSRLKLKGKGDNASGSDDCQRGKKGGKLPHKIGRDFEDFIVRYFLGCTCNAPDLQRRVQVKTPHGDRFVDVAVFANPGDPLPIFAFECKANSSPYTRDQRIKDSWLRSQGVFVWVVTGTVKK